MKLQGKTENASGVGPGIPTSWPTLVIAFALFAVCAFPILAVKVPLLEDYPNHLARMYVIIHQMDEPFSRFFSVRWHIIPDLAMDILIPPLAKIFGIFAGGKLFILMTIVVITSGTYALHYAVYKEWKGPALCFLFVFNTIFFYGFLNYLFAVGLALWATAGWVALRDWSRPLRAIFSTCAVSVLFVSHFGGVGLYALAICCYEMSRFRWRDGCLNLRQISLDGAVALAPFAIVLVLMSASPTSRDWASTEWPMLQLKWVGPYLALKSENLILDALFGFVLLLALSAVIYFKRLEIPRLAWVFLLLASATYLIVPGKVLNVDQVDTRLPSAFVFFLIAIVRWRLDTPIALVLFNGIVAVVLAIRVLGVAEAWEGYTEIVSDYEQSFTKIAPGSRVLVTQDSVASWQGSGNMVTLNMDAAAIIHLPTLATIERSCLVSSIFADPGKQTMIVKAPYNAALPVDPTGSLRVTDLDKQAGKGSMRRGYPDDWRAHYEYVYVQFEPPGSLFHLADLTLVYQGHSFQLYKIAGHKSSHTSPGG